MADNKKRNITGSYPGADGTSCPKRKNPAGSYPSAKGESPSIRIANRFKGQAEPIEQKKTKPQSEPRIEHKQAGPIKEEASKAQEPKAEGKVFTKEVWQKYARALGYYGAILIAAALLSCWICHIGNEVLGLVRPDKEITVMIEEGQNSVGAVAKALKKAEIIDHPNVFFIYSKLKKTGEFYEGEFTLNCKSDYNQLIRALKRDPAQKDKVEFTIKEGYTQEDLVTTLCDSLEYLEREELENVLQNYDFSEFTFAANLPERNYRLEGYLYPDTYEMYEGESAVAVVRRILSRFEEKVLTDETMKKIGDSDFDLDEVITLASILQKESGKQPKKAAGVYLNRLESESVPYLESQATVAYILPAGHGAVTETDIRTSDPYNTYRNTGLPEGPIANPSEEMILAVLEAEKTEDLYFVTREDGEMFFAKSRADHLLNLKKAGENLRGTGTVS